MSGINGIKMNPEKNPFIPIAAIIQKTEGSGLINLLGPIRRSEKATKNSPIYVTYLRCIKTLKTVAAKDPSPKPPDISANEYPMLI
jgi:hypothetical protein